MNNLLLISALWLTCELPITLILNGNEYEIDNDAIRGKTAWSTQVQCPESNEVVRCHCCGDVVYVDFSFKGSIVDLSNLDPNS